MAVPLTVAPRVTKRLDCGIAIVLFRVAPVSLVYYLPAGLAFQVVGTTAW